jgi:hypothetical protein
MSTYSPSLRIELITTGDQAGTWGNTTNTNLGGLIESAIAGYVSVSIISANQALTALNGAPDQSRNQAIALTTTTTAAFNVYAPPAEKTYVIYNASAYAATIYNSTVIGNTTAAGLGVAIPAGKTVTVWSDGTNFAFQNDHLSSLTLGTDLAIADGGTGASTAANARTNLGLGTMATQAANAVSITGGSITGITDLAVADGGTGASTASDARTNLGLGTMATQASNSVSITGGSITGITDLAVADGGTGASTAADARTNLGLGTMATQAANNVSITGGSITGITDLAIADGGTGASDAATARTNLGIGVGTMATQLANNVAITGGSITGITDLAVADGGTGASTAADARTNLGIGAGTMATQAANNVAITGGSISNVAFVGGSVSGITDLAIADGGTGASNAATARSNLGLVIGTNVLAPNGDGSALTNLDANSLTSGTVPATRSGAMRFIASQNVYSGAASNTTISVSVPTSLFGFNTPSFVMFSANAYGNGITDLRAYYVCTGTTFVQNNLVLATSSDDTDESGTANLFAVSTFVLPYSATQQFFIGLNYAAGNYVGLNINVVGYQI